VTDGRWDVAKLGLRSIGLGRDVTATEEDAVAIGALSRATGSASMALGVEASAIAPLSVAIGDGATAQNNGAVVMSAGSDGLINSTADRQVTIRGEGGIRLVPAATAATNCTVATDGSFGCTGGVKVGSSILRIEGPSIVVSGSSTNVARAKCPTGYRLTGGGVATADGDLKVRESYPESDRDWFARVRNDHPFNDGTMAAYALCIRE
jgi:autotransporter adhesin